MFLAKLAIISLCFGFIWASPQINPLVRPKVAHFTEKANLVDYKLPDLVSPNHYTLKLDTDIPTFKFTGTVAIKAKVNQETNVIVLHSDGLTLNSLSVIKTSDGSDVFESPRVNETNHFVTLSLKEKLSVNEDVTINIEFAGTLGTENSGFYRAKYVNAEGKDVWLATTQFESTDARKAFPCFDEPEYKATFDITLVRDKNLNSIANTPLKSSEEVDGKVADTFETTAVMSTYLIAFVISDFKHNSTGEVGQVHEVYARPDQIENSKYALSISSPMMDAMQEFTGIPNYDNKKMTQIAIPNEYFSAGAMENWGLVTYREWYLLLQEGASAESTRQMITRIVAHEYGHQWFGNLVSPKWWTYIWLNEGFATYFEYMAPHAIEPTTRYDEQYVVYSNQYAMTVDVHDTRPMTYDVASRSEIEELFDPIAYQKSGAVIRMMEHFLTTKVFKDGLNKYLNDMKYKGATEEDLYRNLQLAVDSSGVDLGKPLQEIMYTWSKQAGFPMVTVSRKDGKISLSQKRFLNSAEIDDSLWDIPITYITTDDDIKDFENTQTNVWLSEKEKLLDLALADGKWIILNKKSVGYYRVNYDEDLWNAIISLMNTNHETIPPVNRAQLIDDAFNLVTAGYLPTQTLMNLLVYIEKEVDYIPLYSYVINGGAMMRKLSGIEHYEELKMIDSMILQNAIKEVGLDISNEENAINKLNRNMILNWLCYFQDDNCLKKMNETLLGDAKVHPDIQDAAYCGGARQKDGQKAFVKLMSRYTSSDIDPLEKSLVIKGLGCIQDGDILLKLLNDTSLITVEKDRDALLSSIYSNEAGLDVAVVYLNQEYKSMDQEMMMKMLLSVSEVVTKEFQIGLIESVLKELSEPKYESVKKTIQKNLKENKDFINTFGKQVDDWLVENNYVVPTTTPSSANLNTLHFLVAIFVGVFLVTLS